MAITALAAPANPLATSGVRSLLPLLAVGACLLGAAISWLAIPTETAYASPRP